MDPVQFASPPGATSTRQGPQISSDFETFLKMLTAQMQNQDPLNPIDSQDFAVQLATFSGVEQQVQTNQLLQGLETQMGLMGMAQMAGWVGMEARVSAAGYFDGAPITLSPVPAFGADRVELIVKDVAGIEVERRNIPLSAESFSWDGFRLDGTHYPNGLYTFELANYAGTQHIADTPVELYARIIEVKSQPEGVVVTLEGGAEAHVSAVTALR